MKDSNSIIELENRLKEYQKELHMNRLLSRNEWFTLNNDVADARQEEIIYIKKSQKEEHLTTALYRVDELLSLLEGVPVSQEKENRLSNIYKQGIFEKQKESQIQIDPGELLTYIEHRLYTIKNELEGQIEGEQKGLMGEQYVERELQEYSHKYKILTNLVISSHEERNATAETDACIITDKGIIVCEIKNIGNESGVIEISSDGTWIKRLRNSDVIMKKSPVAQNVKHCLAIERLLKKEMDPAMEVPEVIPVVIMGNEASRIINNSMSTVIRIGELYSFLTQLQTPRVSKETQEAIAEILERNRLSANTIAQVSYNKELDTYQKYLSSLITSVKYNNYVSQETTVWEEKQKEKERIEYDSRCVHQANYKVYRVLAIISTIAFLILGYREYQYYTATTDIDGQLSMGKKWVKVTTSTEYKLDYNNPTQSYIDEIVLLNDNAILGVDFIKGQRKLVNTVVVIKKISSGTYSDYASAIKELDQIIEQESGGTMPKRTWSDGKYIKVVKSYIKYLGYLGAIMIYFIGMTIYNKRKSRPKA